MSIYEYCLKIAGGEEGLADMLGAMEQSRAAAGKARCPLEPEDPPCRDCPYWPLCIRADREAWNAPENPPVNWQQQVRWARKAWSH